MYTARQISMLRYLLKQNDYTTYAALADRLSVSSRTLMREMDALRPDLKRARLGIMTKKGSGFMITGSQKDKDALLASLEETGGSVQNKKERRLLLGVDLLKAEIPEKLVFYANRYDVSESTISNDLDLLENDLKPFHIELERKPGLGIQVLGKEPDKRQALSWLSQEALAISAQSEGFDRYNAKDVLRALTSNAASSLKEVLKKEILCGILEMFEDHQDELELESMAMASYTGLVIHLVIVVDRLQKHITLADNEALKAMVKDEQAARKAALICRLLADKFDIEVDGGEEAFIAIHLQSAKSSLSNAADFSENMDLIAAMLQTFKEAGYNLFQDNELIQSLSAHLTPALARIQCNLPITNPLLDQIQQQFPEVYGLSALAGKKIEEKTGLEFNSDEIGYLTLHFAAALERARSKNGRKVRVGVVCASGIGLSSLLCARLKKAADPDVDIKALSMEQALDDSFDLIVSSFQVPNALVVHPILQKEDEQNFLEAIENIRSTKGSPELPMEMHVDIGALVSTLAHFIRSVQVLEVSDISAAGQMIHLLCQKTGLDPQKAQKLEDAVLNREFLSSNIFPDLNLALFHAALDQLETPILLLARPSSADSQNQDERPAQENSWKDEMEDIKLAVLMAVNKKAPHWQRDMLSSFSAMLIEDPDFIEFLTKESEDKIRLELERKYQNWLVAQLKKMKL